MNPDYPAIAQRAGHRCEYCHAPEVIFNFPFEVEHILPLTQKGADDPSNLALSCRACNVRKADHLSGTDEVTNTAVLLFHPRQQNWQEHFDFDPRTATIQGLTPVGRATISRLGINSSVQVAARQQWIALGLFS